MVSFLVLGYVLFSLVSGILIGAWGVKKTFALGFIFMIAGLAGIFFLPRFLSVAAALFVLSASFGIFEVSSNALATQIFTSRAALLMSLLHFFYGAGAILSPRAAGFLASAQGWRSVYLLSIPLVLIFFIPFIFTRFPEKNIETPGTKRTSFFTAIKTPIVWIFAVVLGLMISVELCSANWAGLYFQDVYQLDPKTSGAAFVSNFFILFTISRLVSGFAIEKAGYVRSLFIAGLATVIIFFLGFALGAKGIYILPFLGIFVAVSWPVIMAVAMGYFKEDAPVMTSAIIVIGGAVNSGIQFLIGLTNRLAGPAWGYRSCLLYALLSIAALVVLTRYMRRAYKAKCE
jgi:fucose permease